MPKSKHRNLRRQHNPRNDNDLGPQITTGPPDTTNETNATNTDHYTTNQNPDETRATNTDHNMNNRNPRATCSNPNTNDQNPGEMTLNNGDQQGIFGNDLDTLRALAKSIDEIITNLAKNDD